MSPLAPYRRQYFDRYLTTLYSFLNEDHDDEPPEAEYPVYEREFGPFLPTDRDVPILEIGCGVGGFLHFCRAAGYSAVRGLDVSPELVAACHDRGFEDVVCSDGLSFLLDTRDTYGAVVMSDVLEHVPRKEAIALLHAIRDPLRPDGRVIVRVPNLSNPFNLRTRYVDVTHELGFTRESLEQLLAGCGFDVETVDAPTGRHRFAPVSWVFDRFLWRAFVAFHRHTMRLDVEPLKGKNLLAVGSA